MPKIIHTIHFPVSARSFVEPLVSCLRERGYDAVMWLQEHPEHGAMSSAIRVPFRFLPIDVSCSPIRLTARLWGLYRELRRLRPNVLHAHQTRASLLPLAAALLSGVPVRVYHNHGLPYLGYAGVKRAMLRMIEQMNMRMATHVLLVSRSNLVAAEDDGLLAPGRARVLASGSAAGIDLAEYAPEAFDRQSRLAARRVLGIPEAAYVVAFVGRPVRRKGFITLLEAWLRSGLWRHGACLVTVGCTQAQCDAALGTRVPGVLGLGYQMDVRPVYAACDVVTLPSWHEGLGCSLLEGAAAGRPLVGSDIPGIRCAIIDSQTGLLVRPNDPDSLSDALVRLADDVELRNRLGAQARRRVESEFDRGLVLEALLGYYTDILGMEPAGYYESLKTTSSRLRGTEPSAAAAKRVLEGKIT